MTDWMNRICPDELYEATVRQGRYILLFYAYLGTVLDLEFPSPLFFYCNSLKSFSISAQFKIPFL